MFEKFIQRSSSSLDVKNAHYLTQLKFNENRKIIICYHMNIIWWPDKNIQICNRKFMISCISW